jgi:hypothetical protein
MEFILQSNDRYLFAKERNKISITSGFHEQNKPDTAPAPPDACKLAQTP